MSDKESFQLVFECSSSTEDQYSVLLRKITETLYTDGQKIFEFTEHFVYEILAEEEGKSKKKKVARRKGKALELSDQKDEIVFSPEVVIRTSSAYF